MAITRLGGANAITGTLPAANINDTSIGNITALPSAIPTGKVLQVVTGETGTTVTHSSSFADTGLSASITPASTSNKILILVDQHVYWSANGLTIRILRDSTSVFEQPVAYTLHNGSSGANNRTIYSLQYLDTPSSSSALTFKTQCKLHSSGTIQTQESSNKSRITLMEIAG